MVGAAWDWVEILIELIAVAVLMVYLTFNFQDS